MTDTTSIQNTTAAKDISTRDDEHVDFGFNVFVYVVMFAIVYGLWALGGLPLAVFVLWLFLSASICVAQEHTLRLQSVREQHESELELLRAQHRDQLEVLRKVLDLH